VPNNGGFRQCMCAACIGTVVSTAELVGTERVCQLTVISASQYRACVLLAYVEGRWFPPQNLSVLSFFVLTYQHLWVRACVPTNGDFRQSVPSVCAACICGGTVVSTVELVGTERAMWMHCVCHTSYQRSLPSVCAVPPVSTGQNQPVLSFFVLTCQHLSVPRVWFPPVLVGTERMCRVLR